MDVVVVLRSHPQRVSIGQSVIVAPSWPAMLRAARPLSPPLLARFGLTITAGYFFGGGVKSVGSEVRRKTYLMLRNRWVRGHEKPK